MNKLCFFLPISLLAVSAPPPPPGGVVERQIEQEYEVKKVEAQKQVPLLEVDIPEKQFEPQGETVYISAIEFSGNTKVSSKKLQRVVESYLGHDLSMKELQQICQAVEGVYARKGYFLARAYIPEQEIKEDQLIVKIIEGRLGQVSVVGNRYYSAKFIRNYFEKYRGKPINYDQILRALLLLDENSDLDVGAVFKKGKAFGTADLLVCVTDDKPLHLVFDHNNYGSDHTSTHRTGGRLDWGNLVMDGDNLTVIEVVGSPLESLDFTDFIYHFPLNTYGSAFEISYLFANFKTDKVDKVRYTGRSHIGTGKFLQALHRTPKLNTDFFASFDYKQIQNFGGGIRSSYDRLRVLTGGIEIDYIDQWNGRNLFMTSAGFGLPDFLGGSHIDDSSGSRINAGGRFAKLNGEWRRLQKLPADCFLLVNIFGQYSFDKLPLPEQLYIGGIDNVRGYQLAEGLGDHGFYGTVELHVPPPFLRPVRVPWSKKTWGEFLKFVGFMDHGQTFSIGRDVLHEVGIVADHKKKEKVVQDERVILTSAGAGLRLYGPWKFEWSFDAAYPLTSRHRSSNTILYFRVGLKIL